MTKWEGIDRRKFPRIKYPCLVVIKNESGGEEDVVLSHTENVGVGGVCVIIKRNIKMFSEVNIELDLLDMNQQIKCKGKIVWNVQRKNDESKKPLFYDIGIEFVDLNDKQRNRLTNIVSKLVESGEEIEPYK